MKTLVLIFMGLLLTMQYGAKAQSEPDIIWHTPGVAASSLILSPDEQYVYANRRDVNLGNMFTQLRVDDGTIIRKDVNTVGHIAGFTADGRHAIVVNLRISNVIYKVETETLEKVDSLEFEDVLRNFTAFAFSYDNKYLYLGNYGRREAADTINKDNFYVVDTENFEIIYRTHFLKTVPKTNNIQSGTILGIYPSPDNNYIALNVDAPSETSWLPVLDVRDNYKNIATKPAIEFKSSISRIAFTFDAKKIFLSLWNDKVEIYSTSTFNKIDSLIYPLHSKWGGGAYNIKSSLYYPDIIYISSILPIIEIDNLVYSENKIQKVDINNLSESCNIIGKYDAELLFSQIFVMVDNENNIIANNSQRFADGIFKFKSCTPTSVKDDPNTIQTLQVIDNKLTIPLDAKKGVMLNYQISDIRGLTIIQNSLISNSNELIIDVHHLAPGTYFLTLQILNETVNYKFIIIR